MRPATAAASDPLPVKVDITGPTLDSAVRYTLDGTNLRD